MARRAPTVRRLLPIGLTAIALAGCGGDDENATSSGAGTTLPKSTGAGPTSATRSPSDSKSRPPSGGASSPSSNAQPPPTSTSPPGPAVAPREGPIGTPVGRVPRGSAAADRKAVIRTVRTYLRAIARGNGEQACAQLTSGARRRLSRKLAEFAPETAGVECAGLILLYKGAYRDAIDHPVITGVRVRGNRARAVGPIHQVATLVKKGRLWLISAYGQ
jgi:hypothetical protein